MIFPHITIIAVYRPLSIPLTHFCSTLKHEMDLISPQYAIFIGDFNVDWYNVSHRSLLYNLFIQNYCYRQLVSCYTTDNKTCIDHLYTNLNDSTIAFTTLETYFSDHKSLCATINYFNS